MAAALTKTTNVPEQVRLYHITSWDNLASIVSGGALLPFNELKARGVKRRSIAYSHLQERRDLITVPLSPHGSLHDYVPWSFAARSPMLYTAWRGALGKDIGQNEIVHLVSDVERVVKLQIPFVFTDGHPLSSDLSTFCDDLAQLPSRLDWDVLHALKWSNSEDDGDRKRRRQAEFLMRGAVPWEIVRGIAVYNEEMRLKLAPIVQNSSHQPKIAVLPEWYY